jgi:pimeloyl-ACP methyl ester carboxylesterase
LIQNKAPEQNLLKITKKLYSYLVTDTEEMMFKQLLTTLSLVAAMGAATPSIAQVQGETAMSTPTASDRIAVNGVELHYEIHGEGSPLVMLHGGVNPSDMFGAPLAEMAKTHKVIAIHMRGHGFSTDSDVPWSYEQMADDVAALLGVLGIDKIDVMGWSLGGGVAYQLAIRHPDLVGKLIVISMNVRNSGNFPEVEAAFKVMPDTAPQYAQGVGQSPLAKLYPDVDWEVMFRKTGEMNRVGYDWSADIAGIAAPTLLVFADADMMHPEHMVEIYKLLGGGTRDAGVDGALRPTPNQFAIIPDTTHYDLMLKATESVADYANAFLAR